jgi:hypothetical protein
MTLPKRKWLYAKKYWQLRRHSQKDFCGFRRVIRPTHKVLNWKVFNVNICGFLAVIRTIAHYDSQMCNERNRTRDLHETWYVTDPDDIINHATFGPYRLDGFRSGGGHIWPFPLGLLYGPYNMPRAIALACDVGLGIKYRPIVITVSCLL